MKITFYGHACIGIKINDVHILIDPFISGNPKASHIDIHSIKADYILVTHAHQDHTLDVEVIAKNNDAIVVSNWEIATHYGNKGIKNHPMNFGGNWSFNFGKLRYVQAVHSSSFPNGSYGGSAGGFVIEGEHKNIYISGDTALFSDMKLFAQRTPFDVIILPIGDNFTMDVEDAIIASDFLACDKIIGCHFDTFGFIEIDKNAAKKKFFEKGKDLMLLEIGQSIDL